MRAIVPTLLEAWSPYRRDSTTPRLAARDVAHVVARGPPAGTAGYEGPHAVGPLHDVWLKSYMVQLAAPHVESSVHGAAQNSFNCVSVTQQ